MSIGLLGQKIGMTSVYDANGRLRPVTVIAAGDNVVVRRITAENEGYSAVQVGFGTQKESRLNSSEIGEFKKAGVEPKRFSARVSAGGGFAGRRGEFECHAISGGRLRRCDWSLQRQRVSGGDEET